MERRSVWILSEGGRKSRGSTLESWFSEGAERPGLELEAVWNWKVRSAYFEAVWNRGRGRGYPKSASVKGLRGPKWAGKGFILGAWTPPLSEGASPDWLFVLDVLGPRPGARPAACPPPRGCCILL